MKKHYEVGDLLRDKGRGTIGVVSSVSVAGRGYVFWAEDDYPAWYWPAELNGRVDRL